MRKIKDMTNFQGNGPFGGGYFPPQYPQGQSHAYSMMQQPYLQTQNPPPIYNHLQASGPQVFTTNSAAFHHNNQFVQHHIPPANSGPPPHFFPNPFPVFAANVPPPPFPPRPIPANQTIHGSTGVNHNRSFTANGISPQQSSPYVGTVSSINPTSDQELVSSNHTFDPEAQKGNRKGAEDKTGNINATEDFITSAPTYTRQETEPPEGSSTIQLSQVTQRQNNVEDPKPSSCSSISQGHPLLATEHSESDGLQQTPKSKHNLDTLHSLVSTATGATNLSTAETGSKFRSNLASSSTEANDGRRGLAKSALIDLQKNDIGFQELIKEDIDEEVLAKLYSELDIPLNNSANQTADNAKISHVDIYPHSLPVEAKFSGSQPPKNHFETSEAVSDDASESSLESGEVAEDHSSNKRSPQDSKELSVPAALGGHLSQNLSEVSTRKDKHISQEKKALERKDYIAKLLAAKYSVKTQTDKLARPAQTYVTSDAPAELKTDKVNAKGVTREVKRAEVKDPAQTELVRQRLEALKNNTKAVKPASSYSIQDEIPTKAPDKTGNTNPSISDISVPFSATRDLPQQDYTPEKSFFASSHRTPFGALPGLSPVTASLPGLHSSASRISETSKSAIAATAHALSTPTTKISESQASERSTISRKRATAMDFIESPPRQTKRRVGSGEPISVVIDVSDDDDDGSEDAAIEAWAPSLSETPGALDDTRALRSLPPVTNIPSRGSANSSMNTPVYQNPKNLAAHEEDIKALRQKIQEYELRKKAKKAIAEKQATATAGRSGTIGMPDVATKVQESKGEELEEVNKQLREQKSSLGVLDAAIIVAEEKLHAEERTQALIIARAENERRGAVQASTDLGRQNRLDRKATLEAALPKLELHIQSARSRLDEIRRQQREIEAEIDKGIEGRDELNKELRALYASDDKEFGTGSATQHAIGRFPGFRNTSSLSGDSEVDQTLLQSAPVERDLQNQEITATLDLEPETSHPIQNETFLEESMDISSDEEGQIISSRASHSSMSATCAMSPTLSEQVENRTSPEPPQTTHSRSTGLSGDMQNRETDTETSHFSLYSSGATKYVSANDSGDHDEASRADNLFATVDDVSSRQMKALEPVSSDEEEYEPSERDVAAPGYSGCLRTDDLNNSSTKAGGEYTMDTDGSSHKLQHVSITIDSSTPAGLVSECSSLSNAPYIARQSSDPDDLEKSIEYPSKEASFSNSPQEEGELLEEGSEGLEYEPPEVLGPETNEEVSVWKNDGTGSASNNQEQASEISRSDSPSGLPVDSIQMDESFQTRVTEKDRAKISHFTPYKSPLSLFNSYRYHPQYVSDIPGAFRSLTYNHKIDYARELCQWELAGGICNDSSCRQQHFRDLPSSDSETLISLAKVREGETEGQKNDYVSGLKKLINDMKLRNVNDINSVASEIVAYRSKFLQDSSRVLTNL